MHDASDGAVPVGIGAAAGHPIIVVSRVHACCFTLAAMAAGCNGACVRPVVGEGANGCGATKCDGAAGAVHVGIRSAVGCSITVVSRVPTCFFTPAPVAARCNGTGALPVMGADDVVCESVGACVRPIPLRTFCLYAGWEGVASVLDAAERCMYGPDEVRALKPSTRPGPTWITFDVEEEVVIGVV